VSPLQWCRAAGGRMRHGQNGSGPTEPRPEAHPFRDILARLFDAWARALSPPRPSQETLQTLDRLARLTAWLTFVTLAAAIVVTGVGFTVVVMRWCGILPQPHSHATILPLAAPVGLLSTGGAGWSLWRHLRSRRARLSTHHPGSVPAGQPPPNPPARTQRRRSHRRIEEDGSSPDPDDRRPNA
jgi:hypothetical protein